MSCDCGTNIRSGKTCDICKCVFCGKCVTKLPDGRLACDGCYPYTMLREFPGKKMRGNWGKEKTNG